MAQKVFKSPLQQSESLTLNLKTPTVTNKTLDNEVRGLFNNRKEGLDYINSNFQEGPDKENALRRLERVYPSTRAKWDKYIKNGFKGTRTDYYNKLLEEIESELPFENEEEHKKWLDLGSTWMGEDEWPNLTEKLIGMAEKYDLDPNNIKELKNKYKGKDYAEAINRLKGGEAFGDILNGLVTYEKY